MNSEQIKYFKERVFNIKQDLHAVIEDIFPHGVEKQRAWAEVTRILQESTDRVIFNMAPAYTTLKELEAIVIQAPQEEKEK